MKPPRRSCRLCYRRTDTHGEKLYAVKPGQYLCTHDMALVVEMAALVWPDLVVDRGVDGFLSP